MPKLKLEVLVETRGDEEEVTIYGLPSKKNPAEISDMIIESYEPEEYSLVHISGSIDVNAITADNKSAKK